MKTNGLYAVLLLFVSSFAISYQGSSDSLYPDLITDNFESGNKGEVTIIDPNSKDSKVPLSVRMKLVNDNFKSNDYSDKLDDAYRFRAWFYFKVKSMEKIPIDKDEIEITITNFGFEYDMNPVYSYDQKTWKHFDKDDIDHNWGCHKEQSNPYINGVIYQRCGVTITIHKDNIKRDMYIARAYPYTTKMLTSYFEKIKHSENVNIFDVGKTDRGRNIKAIFIGNFKGDKIKDRIWIHARTHASETGSSYALEGFINQVLSNDDIGKYLRNKYNFYILPMHNVDGVVLGNYRTNAQSENMENRWCEKGDGPISKRWLANKCPLQTTPYKSDILPKENKSVIHYMRKTLGLVPSQKEKLKFAFNLHSSNDPISKLPYFYPHFGTNKDKYSKQEINLYKKQSRFINIMRDVSNCQITPPPKDEDGGSGFTSSHYPETYFWNNNKDDVIAMTMETVYGTYRDMNNNSVWFTDESDRRLGKNLAKSIYYYDGRDTITKNCNTSEFNNFMLQPEQVKFSNQVSNEYRDAHG